MFQKMNAKLIGKDTAIKQKKAMRNRQLHGLSRSKDLGHLVRKRTIFFRHIDSLQNLFCRKSIFLPYLSYVLDKNRQKRCIEHRDFHYDNSIFNRKPMQRRRPYASGKYAAHRFSIKYGVIIAKTTSKNCKNLVRFCVLLVIYFL